MRTLWYVPILAIIDPRLLAFLQVVLDNGALSRIVADRIHLRPDSFDDKTNFDQTNQLVSSSPSVYTNWLKIDIPRYQR